MDHALVREDMVEGLEHEAKGVLRTDRVAEAMRAVPRHEFLDDERAAYADTDHEVAGSRVIAPSTVARLVEALAVEEDDDVLVVGAGVGYTVAVIAEIAGARRVQAVDIDREMVLEARRNLAGSGYGEVLVDRRDGAEGLPEYAPFDRVLVEAAAVEPPGALLDQLAPDGRLVLPEGARSQTLTVYDGTGAVRERRDAVGFAPLLVDGEEPGALERNRTQREDRERARRASQSRAGWEYEWIDWE